MPLDPRTPVIVGVGQVLNRPGPDAPLVEPLDLMVDALQAAAEDAAGSSDGAPSAIGRRLLESVGRLTSVVSFTWRTTNPSMLVAQRLGIDPDDLALAATGGATPQKLVADACRDIMAAKIDIAAVVGAEAMHSRGRAKHQAPGSPIAWTTQDPDTTPRPSTFGKETMPLTDFEISRGIQLPISIYPLFENALRAKEGWGLADHRERLGRLWESLSKVASTNPTAWLREPFSADAIITPSPTNRMISEPYTKLMVANLPVDMGAAFIICSLERAQSLGVADDAFVFPISHAQGDDPWFISERPDLSRSVAIEIAGRRALELAELAIDDIGPIDLYSCFPIAVEMGARALGITPSPDRLVSVTGGLTFGGGPGNNYVSHSLSTMVGRLREQPEAQGLITGLSYYASSHAVGIYSATPPERPFQSVNVQEEIDRLPRLVVDPELHGPVTVETFTITHDRDRGPASATLALRGPGGERSWGGITDPAVLADVTGTDLCGLTGHLGTDGIVVLD